VEAVVVVVVQDLRMLVLELEQVEPEAVRVKQDFLY
jgi:hypothetical protein